MIDGFGRYDVYAVAGSRYCYKDSDVLKNRFGIHDKALLRKVEADITAVNLQTLFQNPVTGRFSMTQLCTIHARLFQQIYPFAGNFRHEDIAKGTTRFLRHTEIKPKLKKLLAALQAERYLFGLPMDTFTERAAYYFAELNYIHPFREGNGRTIREFMRLLFLANDYIVDWSAVPTEVFMDAMVESIYDTAPLIDDLRRCLIRRSA